jgi:quercetin dioxygenase-like cupin family protein
VTGTVTSGVLTLTLGGGGAVLTEGQSVSILFKVTAGK